MLAQLQEMFELGALTLLPSIWQVRTGSSITHHICKPDV